MENADVNLHNTSINSVLVTQSCPLFCDPMNRSLPAPLSMGFSKQEYWNR